MTERTPYENDLTTFRLATNDDFSRIWEIIRQAKAQMAMENRQQWNESYPAPDHIAADIRNGHAYVLCWELIPVAYGAVSFDGEPVYRDIQGKWLSDDPFVVVHRLAVADEMKGKGLATVFMQEVEKMSRKKGVTSFKVDTNFDNVSMQKVLEKLGFMYCGEIIFQRGSRLAYEKRLA